MNKENKVLSIIGIFVVFTVALIVSFNNRNLRKEEISVGDITDKYESIGHYAFATAGNHNVSNASGDYILSYPQSNPNVNYNWLDIKSAIMANDSSITDFSNFTGSYLRIDGTLTKLKLHYTSTSNTGKLVIIFPNGEYDIETISSPKGIIDITNKVNVNRANGWYYVSFVNVAKTKMLAWSLTGIYENENLPLRSIELFEVKAQGAINEILFNNQVQKGTNIQLVGTFTGYENTNSVLKAILDSGEHQLFDRGDGHFTGRNNHLFIRNLIAGEQYPLADGGGALDTFNETLSDEYFSSKKVKGIKLLSSDPNNIYTFTIGVAQDIYKPDVNISTNIEAESKFKTGDKVTTNVEVRNRVDNNGTCAKARPVLIESSIDTAIDVDTTTIKARYKEQNINASYDSTRRVVKVNLSEFDCSSPVMINYDATINETINTNNLEGHIYHIDTVATVKYNIDSDNPLMEETKTSDASVSSPKRIIVTATFTERENGSATELHEPIIQELFYGDDYVTSEPVNAEFLENYTLISRPANYMGHDLNNDMTVNYYYRKKVAKITTKYVDVETGFSLLELTQDVDYGREYTTNEVLPQNPSDPNYKEEFDLYEYTDNYEGVTTGIAKSDVTVTYYYRMKTGTVRVKYIDINKETDPELEADTITTYNYNERYTTVLKDIFLDYEFVDVEGEPTGIVDKPETVIIYKYKRKAAVVYTYHFISGTHDELAERDILNTYWGIKYETHASNQIPDNYELQTKTNNYEGYAHENRIEVIYYYQKKDSSLETSLELTGTEQITSKNSPVTYKFDYEVTLTDYIGDAEIKIVDTLPYEIDVERSNLDGGTYNSGKKTITWTIPWNNINSYNENTKTIVKELTIYYKNIDAKNRTMINSVIAKITLDNNSRSIEDKLSTDVLVPGTILVHHYLQGTDEKIFEDETSTGLTGETYISTAKAKTGYQLVSEKQSMTHTYTEGITEVVYEYIHLQYEINVTNNTIDKGTVTGTEKVYYGEDSVENNIVITANDGYEIETIIVDGVEIEITDKQEMILDNFTDVRENHKIDVTFTEMEIPVPITGKSNYTWIGLLITAIIVGFIIVPTVFLKKKNN